MNDKEDWEIKDECIASFKSALIKLIKEHRIRFDSKPDYDGYDNPIWTGHQILVPIERTYDDGETKISYTEWEDSYGDSMEKIISDVIRDAMQANH